MIIEDSRSVMHYGIKRKSGRYPWGSGDNPYQRSLSFQAYRREMQEAGLTPAEIARGISEATGEKFTTADLRATASQAKYEKMAYEESMAVRLRDKGMSPTAIAERMGLPNESSVRDLLRRAETERTDISQNVADYLKNQVSEKKYVEVGLGNETVLGVSQERMKTSLALLKSEGYEVHTIQVEQVTNPGKYTKMTVLVPPGVTLQEVQRNRAQIQLIDANVQDYGRVIERVRPPISMDPKRVMVRYGEDGGGEMDGTIELRRGVGDLDLQGKHYAQVRIAVGGTHYMKGMAIYADDLPPGVDIRYNTPKPKGTPMMGDKTNTVMKVMDTKNADYPFGAIVSNKFYTDKDGKRKQSLLNPVGDKPGAGEEGGWDWRRSLSSQMLSKQSVSLAKQQLDLAHGKNRAEFENIMKLTNPAVRKKLLESYADGLDTDAEFLRAAALPRQKTAVIIPIRTLKDNEIYAPQFRNGENVVLIRHPHGGTFEIPELKVNNKNALGKKTLGMNAALDAVGINHNVAKRLSGADFDGDTVIVIPNNDRKIKTRAPLKELENFDPITAYPAVPGMKHLKGKAKQTEMGKISNLITDMTIQKAPPSEIAKAVKHSMVVIDAEKHRLNYKLSEQESGIAALKAKYQGREGSKHTGAATIISRARGEIHRPETRLARVNEGGPIDPVTGAKRLVPTGNTKTARYLDKKTGEWVSTSRPVMETTTKMASTKDAHTLVSKGRFPMELVYANHANRTKALANETRLASIKTPPVKRSPSAAVVYKKEVASLDAKLALVDRNRPRERVAQVLAQAEFSAVRRANSDMAPDQIKKLRSQSLTKYRIRTGAHRDKVQITPKEWEAIQAGAVSNTKLQKILRVTDDAEIKKYAMPKELPKLSASKLSRAKLMAANGYTQAEIADHFGVSTSTLANALSD